MKSPTKENIKQIATTKNYTTHVYIGSNDDEFISSINKSLNNAKYKIIGFESDGKKLVKNIKKDIPNILLLDTKINNSSYSEITSSIEKINIPHIAIIDDITDNIIEEIIPGNPFGYLIKPIEIEELERMIDVSVKKHNINTLKTINAKDKIKEKNEELLIEKSNSIFLLVTCSALIISGILARNVTWLQWLLLIPTLTMLFLAISSTKKQEKPIPYEKPPFVSLIIPAHNEEYTIAQTVTSISQIDYTLNGKPNFELIVVNDGSTDSTGEKLSELKKDIPILRIVTRKPPKSGKGKGFVRSIVKIPMILFLRMYTPERFGRKLDKLAHQYDFDKQEYIGGVAWSLGPNERMKKKEYLPYNDVEFCGKKFHAPACWKFYLTQIYGDYMQLPPESKRINHEFDAYIEG